MLKKAEAWEHYTAPAISEILIDRMPDIASAVTSPLEKVDRIVLIGNGNGDGAGVERVTQSITSVLAQLPGFTELVQGLDLPEVVRQIPGIVDAVRNGNGRETPVASGSGAPPGVS
jgi:flotillin